MREENIPGIETQNAISLYGGSDATDEFPVLKAFQQYIDAEQAKSRKRMLSLAILFGVMMAGVVAVFVVLLINISDRNQTLNDRLVEFAMKDRALVQSAGTQPQQDTSAFVSMFARIDALQKQIEVNQQKSDKAISDATKRAIRAEAESQAKKGDDVKTSSQSPSRQSEEIAALKALLEVEKEKLKAEREKLRQAELEAYRRQHYPECYATPAKNKTPSSSFKKKVRKEVLDELDSELDDELNDDDAINYFDDDEDAKTSKPSRRKKQAASPSPVLEKPLTVELKPVTEKKSAEAKAKPVEPKTAVQKPSKEIQLNVGGQTSSWGIPD